MSDLLLKKKEQEKNLSQSKGNYIRWVSTSLHTSVNAGRIFMFNNNLKGQQYP